MDDITDQTPIYPQMKEMSVHIFSVSHEAVKRLLVNGHGSKCCNGTKQGLIDLK